MEPIKTSQTTIFIPSPEPGVEGMWIGNDKNGDVIAIWTLSDEERKAIAAGKDILVTSKQPLVMAMVVEA